MSLKPSLSVPDSRFGFGLLSCPNELLEMIFLEAVEEYFGDPVRYMTQRAHILFSCRRLCAVVLNCARLWTSYSLCPNTSFVELAQMAKRWSSHRLVLRLLFLGENEPLPLPDDGCASLDQTLAFFVEHVPRCTDLRVDMDSFLEFPAVFGALRAANYNLLQTLTIVWNESHLPLARLHSRPMDVPFNGAELTTLSSLRLYNVPFSWNHLSRFTGLTVLVLHFIFVDFAPSMQELASVLRSNPLLTRMSLRLHISSSTDRGHVDTVILPHLVDLDVDWLGHRMVYEFVTLLRFPNLNTLSFTFKRVEDVQSIYCGLWL
ncbi:hypothetical protein C8R47DRAFT_751965 [Mycena vitilis]|nr:hypothetical protein C8R47DRAFT_751965 [Mycena vitilis]